MCNILGGNSPVECADTLWGKNVVEIALSLTVSKINAFLRFMQKFKMATKNGGESDFCKKSPADLADTLQVKNFVEIALSQTTC